MSKQKKKPPQWQGVASSVAAEVGEQLPALNLRPGHRPVVGAS